MGTSKEKRRELANEGAADLIDLPTCRDVGDGYQFRCSKCGCEVDTNDMEGESTMWLEGCIAFAPRFCPNCGAKVTEEEE